MDKVQTRRCYVSMLSAAPSLISNFDMPECSSIHFASNPDTLVAEGFIDFHYNVYTTDVHDKLAELGACSINVIHLKNHDNWLSAVSALARIRDAARSNGFVQTVRGCYNIDLSIRAEQMQVILDEYYEEENTVSINDIIELKKQKISKLKSSIQQSEQLMSVVTLERDHAIKESQEKDTIILQLIKENHGLRKPGIDIPVESHAAGKRGHAERE